jgi:hypothetical protein
MVLLHLGYNNNILYMHLLSHIHATFPAHLTPFDFVTKITFCEQYRSFSSSLCSFLHSLVTSSLLCPNTLTSTLLFNTFSVRYFVKVSDHVSHTYETRGKKMRYVISSVDCTLTAVV